MKTIYLKFLLLLGLVFAQQQGNDISNFTYEKFTKAFPNLKPDVAQNYYPQLIKAMTDGGINTNARISAFVAQISSESGGLTKLDEIPKKSDPRFLRYDNREILGNFQAGDGERFKGRGVIQLTGRWNYQDLSNKLDHDFVQNPEDASDPEYMFDIAVQYWNDRGLSLLADHEDQESFDQITKKINGGLTGKADRDSNWENLQEILDDGANDESAGNNPTGDGNEGDGDNTAETTDPTVTEPAPTTDPTTPETTDPTVTEPAPTTDPTTPETPDPTVIEPAPTTDPTTPETTDPTITEPAPTTEPSIPETPVEPAVPIEIGGID